MEQKQLQSIGGYFVKDTFEQRRANQEGAGVAFDTESLLSGKESALGMTYDNSHREWPNEESYALAVEGKMTTEEVLEMHPRVLNGADLSVFDNWN